MLVKRIIHLDLNTLHTRNNSPCYVMLYLSSSELPSIIIPLPRLCLSYIRLPGECRANVGRYRILKLRIRRTHGALHCIQTSGAHAGRMFIPIHSYTGIHTHDHAHTQIYSMYNRRVNQTAYGRILKRASRRNLDVMGTNTNLRYRLI